MKRKETTILYCSRCRMTTPHGVTAGTCTCKRCGAIKTTDRIKARHKDTKLGEALAEPSGHWN